MVVGNGCTRGSGLVGWGRELKFTGRVEYEIRFTLNAVIKQESCAIAKTTARCALYIAALKILESP